jgi:antirestriction protein ArdC
MRGKSDGDKRSPEERINERILELLDSGVAPWRKPWRVAGPCGGGMRNLLTKAPYEGPTNVMMLSLSMHDSPWWCTYKQAERLGAHVRRGERGIQLSWYSEVRRADEESESGWRSFKVLRLFTVFNACQLEGLPEGLAPGPEPEGPTEERKVEEAEAIVAGYRDGPEILRRRGVGAFYSPGLDRVVVPPPEDFEEIGKSYSVLFHELAHSTGSRKRLGRDLSGGRGSQAYAREELVAELAAAYLCGRCGLANDSELENSAAYLKFWSERLREDPKMFVSAARKSTAAANHILGIRKVGEIAEEKAA